MPRPHREVGAAEVEEQLRGSSLVAGVSKFGEPQVIGKRWLQRVVEEMLDREWLGEIRAGGFPRPGPIVEVDLASRHDHRSAVARGHVASLVSTARSLSATDSIDSSRPS